MARNFSFADFTRQCRDNYSSEIMQTGAWLEPLYHECETLLEEYHPERFNYLACRAGCGNCCIVNVSVLLPEALAIVDYIEEWPAKIPELRVRLDLLWTRVRGVNDDDRVSMRQPCIFLDKMQNCSIYPVRPLLCRGVNSTDVEDCKESLNAHPYNETLAVRMNLFQFELYSAAYLGLSDGLEESGLDGRGFELTGIFRYLLSNPGRRQDLQSGLRLSWSELA